MAKSDDFITCRMTIQKELLEDANRLSFDMGEPNIGFVFGKALRLYMACWEARGEGFNEVIFRNPNTSESLVLADDPLAGEPEALDPE